MPTPSTGAIKFSDVRAIIKPAGGFFNLNDSNGRTLAGVVSGAISLSQFRNKPTAGSFNITTSNGYAVNTTYTFLCPPYQNMTVTTSGGGGGGGGGDNHNSYGAGNNGYNGGAGVASTFSYTGFTTNGYGGVEGYGNNQRNKSPSGASDSTGSFTGSGGSLNTGGGGAGGIGGAPQQGCCSGGDGGDGGRSIINFIFNSTTYNPPYETTLNVYMGAGGGAAPQNASAGSPGSIIISYS
jgi:hypothetical protein